MSLGGHLETEQVEMWNKHVGLEVWKSVGWAHLEAAIWEPCHLCHRKNHYPSLLGSDKQHRRLLLEVQGSG